ncbi:hypothetical protein D3C87_1808020 [compost metagenome]
MNMVSEAILSCLSRGMLSSVRILCRRSASFTRITRTSSESVSSIFRKFSACCDEPYSKRPEILVSPSIIFATFLPNSRSMSSIPMSVSSTTSCSNAATIPVVPSPISSTTIWATASGW